MTSYIHIVISPLVINAHAAGLGHASGINKFDIFYLHVHVFEETSQELFK